MRLIRTEKKTSQIVFASIVMAQFCGTSLWFAGNAILPQLQAIHGWPSSALAHLTGIVQLGFITGTLIFALLGLADRFSPGKLFFISCIMGSLCNGIAAIDNSSFSAALVSRGLTGFCLAGIYPVGMKIASDWRKHGLGNWLGALVGALVVGTAFPHALKALPHFPHPNQIIFGVSALAILGGIILIMFVGDGPYRQEAKAFSFKSVGYAFSLPSFRAPAFGYFGHMWELYTLWAFVPWILRRYSTINSIDSLSLSWLSFIVIASGGLGCWIGGKLSITLGSLRIARYTLIISGFCCLISPWVWHLSPVIFISYMIIWGITVVADSPQFSALVAMHSPPETRGSALTLVTCIGFTITIVSIQILNYLENVINKDFLFLFLFPGPLMGVLYMRNVSKSELC